MRQPGIRTGLRLSTVTFPPGVKWLLIANVAMFLLWYLGGEPVQRNLLLLALTPTLVVHSFPFFIWQLFTYMFLHGSIGHLLFNMLALWMFGTPLEQGWGTRRFLKFYFVCGVGAGVCDTLVNVALGHQTHTIGASGALYGLLLAFGLLYPDTRVLMNFLFPIKAKYLVIIYGAIACSARSARTARQQRSPPGRHAVRVLVSEEPLAGGSDARPARRLPPVEAPAGQEEIPGLHAETGRARAPGQLTGNAGASGRVF